MVVTVIHFALLTLFGNFNGIFLSEWLSNLSLNSIIAILSHWYTGIPPGSDRKQYQPLTTAVVSKPEVAQRHFDFPRHKY